MNEQVRQMDILDLKTRTLYCSVTCAEQAGAVPSDCVVITHTDYDLAYEDAIRDGLGNPYGVVCPVCKNLYNSL